MKPDPKPAAKVRPFPWHCIECGQDQIVPLATDFTITVKHDGRPYDLRIPNLEIPTCRNCGEQVFTGPEDDRITAALREQIGLLMPEEIQRHRKQLKLSQQELAEHLGVAKETISRWESGAVIQSRAMDNLLRLFFESPEARELLARKFKSALSNRITNWKHTPETDDHQRRGREVFSRN